MTRSIARCMVATLVAAALAGCAGNPPATTGPAPSRPAATPAAETPRAHPGFDASVYPGDSVMRAWRASSPYRWVGCYLAAPCHRDASWMGTRARLEAAGWGHAILYVGQQAWEGVPDRDPADTAAAGRPIVCSRTLLTAAPGRMDADDAIAKAAAEGFGRGS